MTVPLNDEDRRLEYASGKNERYIRQLVGVTCFGERTVLFHYLIEHTGAERGGREREGGWKIAGRRRENVT
ncbi:hypothetical protein [Streptomyces sp. NPDC059918]|uniref:hypothetical protein n=1 Tax=unclassified Streptomyces TaxID=2593676 RepID=UPI0036473F8A